MPDQGAFPFWKQADVFRWRHFTVHRVAFCVINADADDLFGIIQRRQVLDIVEPQVRAFALGPLAERCQAVTLDNRTNRRKGFRHLPGHLDNAVVGINAEFVFTVGFKTG